MPVHDLTRRTLLGGAMLGLPLIGALRADALPPVRIGGTGSALGLLQALGQAYRRTAPEAEIEVVRSLGSSGGIAAAHAGKITLAVSSRELNAREEALGLVNRPFLETPLLFASNTPVPMALRTGDILRIYAGEMVRWPDGGLIRLILRPRSDAQAIVLTRSIPGLDAAMELARTRRELPVAGNDHDNLDLATAARGTLTAFPLIQLRTEPNELRPIRLDGVEPTPEAMQAGGYGLKVRFTLLHRPQDAENLAPFLTFLGSDESRAMIAGAGGVPL